MAEDDKPLTEAEMKEYMQYVKMLEEGYGTGYPMQDQDKSMVGFFREIVSKLRKTFRSSNLGANDDLPLVRGYLDTAHYASQLGLKGVGKFLEDEALIISDTSLSKEGFLIKAAITTRKDTAVRLGEERKKKKSVFDFSNKNESDGGLS